MIKNRAAQEVRFTISISNAMTIAFAFFFMLEVAPILLTIATRCIIVLKMGNKIAMRHIFDSTKDYMAITITSCMLLVNLIKSIYRFERSFGKKKFPKVHND